MTKIVVYIATSRDGFIADERGSVDFLPQTVDETGGQDFGYHEFYNSIDALAIGRKTYEQILGFGDWPYPGKPSYIFTRKAMESTNQDIHFVSDILSFIEELPKKDIKKLWIVGGAEIIDDFYQLGKIDAFILTVFPTILKNGIPLKTLRDAIQKDELDKLPSIHFGLGVYEEHYVKKRS